MKSNSKERKSSLNFSWSDHHRHDRHYNAKFKAAESSQATSLARYFN